MCSENCFAFVTDIAIRLLSVDEIDFTVESFYVCSNVYILVFFIPLANPNPNPNPNHSMGEKNNKACANWWEVTWRCHTAAVETGNVRHVGCHSERHTRSVIRSRDVPDSRRSSRGGSRKEKKQVLLTKPIVLVCSNRGRNDGDHQQRRDGLFVRTWKAHHTMYRWPPRVRLPLSATIRFNLTLQCGRYLGTFTHTSRHDPPRTKCNRSSICSSSPWDLWAKVGQRQVAANS